MENIEISYHEKYSNCIQMGERRKEKDGTVTRTVMFVHHQPGKDEELVRWYMPTIYNAAIQCIRINSKDLGQAIRKELSRQSVNYCFWGNDITGVVFAVFKEGRFVCHSFGDLYVQPNGRPATLQLCSKDGQPGDIIADIHYLPSGSGHSGWTEISSSSTQGKNSTNTTDGESCKGLDWLKTCRKRYAAYQLSDNTRRYLSLTLIFIGLAAILLIVRALIFNS